MPSSSFSQSTQAPGLASSLHWQMAATSPGTCSWPGSSPSSRKQKSTTFITAATAATRAGLSDHLIKAFRRGNSEAYQTYVSTPLSSLAAISSAIARLHLGPPHFQLDYLVASLYYVFMLFPHCCAFGIVTSLAQSLPGRGGLGTASLGL